MRKMVERKAFLSNLKHQYRVSQYGEQDCSANSKRNGDYYEYPSLSHFTDELCLKIKSMNIVYPKEENMIVMPIKKRI